MDVSENAAGWGEHWPAPAKLNLMLKIVGRKEDGYHLLQTVFQFIDFCDFLTFHRVVDGRIHLKNPIQGVNEQDELAFRAANLLRKYTGCTQGVCIEIQKSLPMGGGLGGGSSDAATTLLVLNNLWKLGLNNKELMALGLQLGADVPVFVYGKAAWGEGVGEKLQSLEVPERWVVIIKPDCHVNTRQIFLADNLTRNSKPITMADFIKGDFKNDCADIVSHLYPQVKEALSALSEFGEARLTGTGSCVFAQFDSENEAKSAYERLKSDWSVYVARGLNKSPLHRKLEHG